MDENMQKRLILILGISTCVFFIATIGSCSNSHRQRVARDKEMTARLSLEEKTNKLMQEKVALEEKLNKLNEELAAEKLTHKATREALAQEELVNQSLREELQRVSNLKESETQRTSKKR